MSRGSNEAEKELYEPIKTILGNDLDDCIIDLITPLVFYHKGKSLR